MADSGPVCEHLQHIRLKAAAFRSQHSLRMKDKSADTLFLYFLCIVHYIVKYGSGIHQSAQMRYPPQ